MRKVRLNELVMDTALYPRVKVSQTSIDRMKEALLAGETLPPIVVWLRDGKPIVIDGVHRKGAHEGVGRAEIEAIEKEYANEAEAFADAVRYNTAHGNRLSAGDMVHCSEVAARLKIEPDQLSAALRIRVQKVGAVMAQRPAAPHTPDRTLLVNQLLAALEKNPPQEAEAELLERLKVLGQAIDKLIGATV